MLNKYNHAQPGPTKVNKKGYPHRGFAKSYNSIPLRCELPDAYAASYTRPDRPTRPGNHCGADEVDWAPDGTLWKLECQPERRKRVCRWKLEDDQPRLPRAGTAGTASTQYQKVKQIGSTPAGTAARPAARLQLPPPVVMDYDRQPSYLDQQFRVDDFDNPNPNLVFDDAAAPKPIILYGGGQDQDARYVQNEVMEDSLGFDRMHADADPDADALALDDMLVSGRTRSRTNAAIARVRSSPYPHQSPYLSRHWLSRDSSTPQEQ